MFAFCVFHIFSFSVLMQLLTLFIKC